MRYQLYKWRIWPRNRLDKESFLEIEIYLKVQPLIYRIVSLIISRFNMLLKGITKLLKLWQEVRKRLRVLQMETMIWPRLEYLIILIRKWKDQPQDLQQNKHMIAGLWYVILQLVNCNMGSKYQTKWSLHIKWIRRKY